jgi:hypothetical protein
VGEECEIVGFRETRKTVCTGVEMFKKQLDEGLAGDNAGLLLRGIAKEDVERGMVLAKPGSITPHTTFKGEIYVLSKEEGGRHTPFFDGYRPQFYFRTTDVTGSAKLPAGTEMVMPGDNVAGSYAAHPGGHGEGPALRHPRRRQDRRRRYHLGDHQVKRGGCDGNRVDGYRSTNENWLTAHRIPSSELPPITLRKAGGGEAWNLRGRISAQQGCRRPLKGRA